jgi:hypothetical protein
VPPRRKEVAVIPFLGVIFDAAVLWFIIVYVTQDHMLSWYHVLTWRLAAAVAGGLCYLGFYFLEIPVLGLAVSVIVSLLVMYLILGRQGYSRKQILTVLAVYVGATVVRFLPRLIRAL